MPSGQLPIPAGKSEMVVVPLLAHEDRVPGVEVLASPPLGGAVLGGHSLSVGAVKVLKSTNPAMARARDSMRAASSA